MFLTAFVYFATLRLKGSTPLPALREGRVFTKALTHSLLQLGM